MNKKNIIAFIILLLFIVGCDRNDNTSLIKTKGVGIGKEICYTDSKEKQQCYENNLKLYVEYDNKELEIEEALNENLITLKDIKRAYNKYEKENPIIKISAALEVITCFTDIETKICFGCDLGLYVLYNNERIEIKDALDENLITLEDISEVYYEFTGHRGWVEDA